MRGPRGGTTRTAVTALIVCCGAITKGQEPSRRQPPEFRSGVELVTVDVGVVDRQGQPLRGLGPEDFVVTVAGKPRRVVSAEFAGAPPAGSAAVTREEAAAVSTNEGGGTGRLFVFVVDESTLDTGSARRVAAAASRFLGQLTLADRSALMLLPVGPNIGFTWAHDRVRAGLANATGLGPGALTWEYGSLAEARDIAMRGQLALRGVAERECAGALLASSDLSSDPVTAGANPRPGTEPPPPGGTSPPGGTGGGTTPTGGGAGTGTGATPTRSPASAGGMMNPCVRNLQLMAELAWRTVQMTSLASLAALRQAISELGRVRGDKTIILISGGWPLDEREETSLLATVASDAAAARATLFTVYVSTSAFSAERRTLSPTPVGDQYLHLAPLERLAAMTGGGSFRADAGAAGVFDRLSRELGGYYRIGVEREPGDATAKAPGMKVRVTRGGVTVRARAFFDASTYEDRDWAARLDAALEAPATATGVGLRVTSYLSAGQEGGGRLTLMLAGEASRMQPGPATLQLVVRDLQGRRIVRGEQPLEAAEAGALPFAVNVGLAPGSYIVRVAVLDAAGRVGSVDHRVDVRPVTIGRIGAMGPLLIRVPPAAGAAPRLALDSVRQDERLAMQVDVEAGKDDLTGAKAVFEIAATSDGPALVESDATFSAGAREGSAVAQAVADMRLLPPGRYVVRAKLTSGQDATGEIWRAFAVEGASAGGAANADAGAAASPAVVRVPSGAVPSFALEQVLAPQVVAAFIDRVAARPDAASPSTRELLERARTADLAKLAVPDASDSDGPVPAFLRGLVLLAQNKLDPAANAFRAAMRASPDFYPAMVYVGACYAAGGNDKQAAGAWRTALIKEGDAAALHVWLADALLRQGRAAEAIETVELARARWPDDKSLDRRFVAAALLAGRPAEGLEVLDTLVADRAEDEPSLTFGLLVLYEAFVDGRPIENVESDRARMTRLAAAYRARGGPSQALVDTWLAAATK